MVSKKAIILIAVVAVVAVGGFLAFGAAVSEDNARYNYELKFIDSYQSEFSSYVYQAPEGKKYLVLDGVIANDNVADGFTNNPFLVDWAVELPNHTSLTYLNSEDSYPDPDLIRIEKGGKAGMALCWEVDADLSLDDLKVTIEYDGGTIVNFAYDSTLHL